MGLCGETTLCGLEARLRSDLEREAKGQIHEEQLVVVQK
jgi:hypothetical protein